MRLTDEQRKAMGLLPRSEVYERGWSSDQIKQAIADKGFTLAEFERECGFSYNSVSQALKKRYPKIDKAIAGLIGVHESTIWPNRYFVNGVAIASAYRIETKSDEVLAKLNADVSKPVEITVVHDWHGEDGKPVISKFTPPSPKITHEPGGQPRNNDGTVNHPFYDEPIAPDVPARADERNTVAEIVTLPVGMVIDVK